MKEFKITQNYGKGNKGFIYFKTMEVDFIGLETIAKKEMVKEWESINHALYFSTPEKPKPTIKVVEVKKGKKVKGGIQFKTKWR